MDAPSEPSSSGGYGPIRRKQEEVRDRESGIVFRPAEVEEAVPMDADEASDEETAGPYDKPKFAALSAQELAGGKKQMRRIPVPQNRLTPLRNQWMEMIQPLVEHMKLQVRMNTRRRAVEIRTSENTDDVGSLQKASDFVKAFMMGFDIQDALALLRLDDLFIQSFEVKDVKELKGDHLSRCIGRIAGKDGKTKYAIENSTRTRVVLQDEKIHILGSFANIKLARDAICSLILGSNPGKVYTRLRTVSKRLQERV
jgi:RNA-binding protein PNO1